MKALLFLLLLTNAAFAGKFEFLIGGQYDGGYFGGLSDGRECSGGCNPISPDVFIDSGVGLNGMVKMELGEGKGLYFGAEYNLPVEIKKINYNKENLAPEEVEVQVSLAGLGGYVQSESAYILAGVNYAHYEAEDKTGSLNLEITGGLGLEIEGGYRFNKKNSIGLAYKMIAFNGSESDKSSGDSIDYGEGHLQRLGMVYRYSFGNH